MQRIQSINLLNFFPEKTFLRGAFVTQSDSKSADSISSNTGQIDIGFPDWLSMTTPSCAVVESIDWNIFEILSQNKIPVLPRFSNTRDATLWQGSEFIEYISDQKKGACLISVLKSKIINRGVLGIHIDIIGLQPKDRDIYTDWLISLVDSFHHNGLFVTVGVDLDSAAYDYPNISRTVDAVIIK